MISDVMKVMQNHLEQLRDGSKKVDVDNDAYRLTSYKMGAKNFRFDLQVKDTEVLTGN